MHIAVIEPQCWDLEHATFNAALLLAVRAGYPEATISFSGEAGHIQALRALVPPVVDASVEWRTIRISPRLANGWGRFVAELRLYRSILHALEPRECRAVLFASVTNTGVLALTILGRTWPTRSPILAVMHGMINRIVGRWPRKPWNWPLNLRAVLRLPHPRSVWFLLLGDSLLHAMATVQPRFAPYFRAIDIPSLDHGRAGASEHSSPPRPLRFGHLGVANITKGFGPFAQLAAATRAADPKVEFWLVGHLTTYRDDTDYSSVLGVEEEPLAPAEYERRAAGLTYVINLSNPADYHLAVSSSFVEALWFGKPGIYLRNSYIDHCFQVMGDIGYLCSDLDEVSRTVRDIVREFPAERYARQLENIARGRRMFEPAAVGRRLRQTVDDVAR